MWGARRNSDSLKGKASPAFLTLACAGQAPEGLFPPSLATVATVFRLLRGLPTESFPRPLLRGTDSSGSCDLDHFQSKNPLLQINHRSDEIS